MTASAPVRFQEFYLLGIRRAGEQFIEQWVIDVEAGEPVPIGRLGDLRAPLTFTFDKDASRALRVPQRLAEALAVACSTRELTVIAVKLAAVELSKLMAS